MDFIRYVYRLRLTLAQTVRTSGNAPEEFLDIRRHLLRIPKFRTRPIPRFSEQADTVFPGGGGFLFVLPATIHKAAAMLQHVYRKRSAMGFYQLAVTCSTLENGWLVSRRRAAGW